MALHVAVESRASIIPMLGGSQVTLERAGKSTAHVAVAPQAGACFDAGEAGHVTGTDARTRSPPTD